MPTFTDDHGVRIHYDSWRVPDPNAVIQLSHGIGEHVGRYGELIEALNAAGYSVWADDHRGHGRTGFEQHGGDLSRIGRPGPGGMRAAIDGVGRFTEIIRDAEGGDLPLVILGQSWGSFIAQHLVNRHPERYDGVVLTASAWLQLGYTNTGDLNKRFATPDWPWMRRDGPDTATVMLGSREFRTVTSACWDATVRLADMDREGVDVQIVSATPVLFAYGRPAAEAMECARIFNDALIEPASRYWVKLVEEYLRANG